MINKVKLLLSKYKMMPIQIRASLWFLICSFLQKGISVITTPIFTRLLSTSEYGQYGVFNSWLGIITVVVSMHLYSGVYTQGLIKFSDNRDVFSSALQGLLMTLTIIWTLIYLLFRSFFNSLFGLTTVQMVAMMFMIWATGVFNFWASEQRVLLSYKKLVAITLIVSFAKPIVGVFFVLCSNDKVTARILGLAFVEVIGYVGLFISQMKKGKVFFSAKIWKYAIFFCIPIIPHYLSQTILNGADKIMIQNMVGKSEAGIYNLAYQVSLLMTLVNTALIQTVNPWIYQKIKDKKTNEICKVAYPSILTIAIVNILLISFAPEIVMIFAPKSYQDAIYVIPPVAMSVLFMFEYALFADFEFYFEKKSFISLATMISAVMNIILNYIFIRIFGYYAAGYTTLFCYAAYTFGHYIFMNKICREENILEVYNKKILLCINMGFILLGFLLLATYSFSILRYSFIVLFIITIILYRKKIVEVVKKLMLVKKQK